MFRRLHFLLPNARLAQDVANELIDLGVNNNHIHTYAEHDLPLESLKPASHNQSHDRAQQIENFLWNGNLIVFAIFLATLIASLVTENYQLSLVCLSVMLVSFALGNFFTQNIPHVHLNQFKDAVSHNELLMMIDVPNEDVGHIEYLIHRHHPAAIDGGSSWTLKNADI